MKFGIGSMSMKNAKRSRRYNALRGGNQLW